MDEQLQGTHVRVNPLPGPVALALADHCSPESQPLMDTASQIGTANGTPTGGDSLQLELEVAGVTVRRTAELGPNLNFKLKSTTSSNHTHKSNVKVT